MNCMPPLSSHNHYAPLDVDLIEENSTTSSNLTDEKVIAQDIQQILIAKPEGFLRNSRFSKTSPPDPENVDKTRVKPLRLPRWERRLPRKYVVASTPSANSLSLTVEIMTADTQETKSVKALLNCGATGLFLK